MTIDYQCKILRAKKEKNSKKNDEDKKIYHTKGKRGALNPTGKGK